MVALGGAISAQARSIRPVCVCVWYMQNSERWEGKRVESERERERGRGGRERERRINVYLIEILGLCSNQLWKTTKECYGYHMEVPMELGLVCFPQGLPFILCHASPGSTLAIN